MRAVVLALTVMVSAFAAPGTARADWPVYGHDLGNSRNAGAAGPAPGAVAGMQATWTFASPHGDFTGTPVVAAGRVVAGTNLGTVYALDAVTGRLLWSRDVGAPINGTAAIDARARRGGTVLVPAAQLGAPRLVALSLRTGALRWQRTLTRQPGADVFGSPAFWRGTVYIGTSGPNSDEATARGSVVALSEATGRVRWHTFTVPPHDDGGGVWTTPAIDTRSGLLYVGSGNAYHPPAAPTTDAILELRAADGRILRHFQSTPGDVWELNNPTAGPDYDFGASPNLLTAPGGRRLVGEGQKSGIYWALDRATLRPVWHTPAGPGSGLDGGINSTAYDGRRIYGSDAIDSQVFALSRAGAQLWSSPDVGVPHFSPVAVGRGVVWSADPAGFLTARDGASGAVLGKLPLGAPTFGGLALAGRAVYVAIGTGPPPAPAPGVDTSQADGNGSIVAFGDTSRSGAGPAARAAATTFSGDCSFSGPIHFSPPLTNAPRQGAAAGTLHGTCSGTLEGARGQAQALSNRAVTLAVHSDGLESCGAGHAQGDGVLAFGRRRLRLTYDETRAGPAPTLRVHGVAGGSGIAQANVDPSASPVAIAQACGAAGLTGAPLDATLRTTPALTG